MNFLARYGAITVFAALFLEQAGVPVPAVPVMLGAGALIGAGELNAFWILFLSVLGSLGGDFIWYEIGRRKGAKVLRLLCKISMEPDSCVRRIEHTFVRYGVKTLLAAKFIPGFALAAPPLAGIFNVPRRRFALYGAAGAAIYCGCFLLLGYIFRAQIETLLVQLAHLGKMAIWIVAALLGSYVLFQFLQRKWVLYRLRTARITPEQLHERLASDDKPMIIDLRSDLEFNDLPYVVPGAIHMTPESLNERFNEIPRDKDVVLYCSCPNEIGSGHFAMRLRRKGLTRIRLLLGGINSWRYMNYDFEKRAV